MSPFGRAAVRLARSWPAIGVLALAITVAACRNGKQPSEPDPPVKTDTGITLVEVARGLDRPVHLTAPPGDPRLFVVEQQGRIRIIANGTLLPTPFLDIADRVSCCGERGLFSVAFDPDYATTGLFWVNFTDNNGHTRIERYSVSDDPDVADDTAVPVLMVEQPFSNHNGGQIAFGPDRMLYIGMGDGGSGGDPDNNGQRLETLLGDLLRIDVRSTTPYAIPPDNPYAESTSARPEIWSSGLRNPWRFSFDHAANMIYIADVGQNEWEEINAMPADSGPINYGWRTMEGRHCYNPSSGCNQQGLTLPVHEYSHSAGCSVTGGYVYRGDVLTGLEGHYFYSDYCAGFLRSFRLVNGNATDHREWDVGDLGNVLSLGEDAAGELYILTLGGFVYRLSPDT